MQQKQGKILKTPTTNKWCVGVISMALPGSSQLETSITCMEVYLWIGHCHLWAPYVDLSTLTASCRQFFQNSKKNDISPQVLHRLHSASSVQPFKKAKLYTSPSGDDDSDMEDDLDSELFQHANYIIKFTKSKKTGNNVMHTRAVK